MSMKTNWKNIANVFVSQIRITQILKWYGHLINKHSALRWTEAFDFKKSLKWVAVGWK
jgi:hypothetical protein